MRGMERITVKINVVKEVNIVQVGWKLHHIALTGDKGKRLSGEYLIIMSEISRATRF